MEKLAIVTTTIWPMLYTFPAFFVLVPFSFVCTSICVDVFPTAMSKVAYPLANILVAIRGHVLSTAMRLTIHESTTVHLSIWVLKHTFAMSVFSHPLSDKTEPSSKVVAGISSSKGKSSKSLLKSLLKSPKSPSGLADPSESKKGAGCFRSTTESYGSLSNFSNSDGPPTPPTGYHFMSAPGNGQNTTSSLLASQHLVHFTNAKDCKVIPPCAHDEAP
eukprot:CAMPEP_0169222626 /NCGR_PEP_ID=MMETSP1016-20121227/21699_1 /TAXON_ID=342587 /ORGANISM="Karlodinium micrum, Strain CCMP2283" /LENGTH=217 /DNA_ID=CAMNT_0009300947 /DNA_START=358 /DNA_END=1012 /DNA_ORIENTATION=+